MIIQQEIKNSTNAEGIKITSHVSKNKDKTKKVSEFQADKKEVKKNQVQQRSLPASVDDNIDVRLEVEKSLHMVVTKIVHKESGEVLRQIPPEEKINISKAIKDITEKIRNRHRIDREA